MGPSKSVNNTSNESVSDCSFWSFVKFFGPSRFRPSVNDPDRVVWNSWTMINLSKIASHTVIPIKELLNPHRQIVENSSVFPKFPFSRKTFRGYWSDKFLENLSVFRVLSTWSLFLDEFSRNRFGSFPGNLPRRVQ